MLSHLLNQDHKLYYQLIMIKSKKPLNYLHIYKQLNHSLELNNLKYLIVLYLY